MNDGQLKESSIILTCQNDDSVLIKPNSFQRTKDWHEKRRGSWTASQMKALMSCGQSGARISWNEKAKIYQFGKTALKYIYENAMERKTGRYIDLGEGTQKMKYGTKIEPIIFKRVKKKLKEFGKLKEVGYKEYPNFKTAGVSSDGIIYKGENPVATLEIKACTNWATHYDRTFELMDEKGIDFWQTQSQMLAWAVDTCYYAVAEPPHNINDFLYYKGDIMDLSDNFIQECKVTIQKIKASPIHQSALMERIMIGDVTINKWLKNGGDIKEILYATIEDFKHQEKSI